MVRGTRDGDICVRSTVQVLGRSGVDQEPTGAHERLLWNLGRAVDDVEPTFNLYKAGRRYRGLVRVRAPSFPARLSPSTAVHVANLTIQAIREARAQWAHVERIDVFLGGPAGLAVLLGQLFNTLPPIQTFDLVHTGGAGSYEESALIKPGLAA